MARKEIPGIVIVPELFKIADSNLEFYATRYKLYADRAKNELIYADTFMSDAKYGFSYTRPLFEDTVIFFTTEIQLRHKVTGDLQWCGESPLTRAVLRKDRFSSSGIIVTPEITVTGNDDIVEIDLSAYIRYEGIAVHESTDYIIDDEITGEVIYRREDDKENLTTLKLTTSKMESGRLYRVRARFKDVLGKYSNYADAIYGKDNFLDLLFPDENMVLMYGKTLLLKPNLGNELVFDQMSMKMTITDNAGVSKSIVYNNGFCINSMNYSVGQILTAEITYGLRKKTITIFISKTQLIPEYDTTFELNGLYKTLSASSFLLTGVGTSSQRDDGYIYDINPTTNKLSKIAYNDTTSVLEVKEELIPIGTTADNAYRTIIDNPLGGMIIITSTADGLGTQKLYFINTDSEAYYVEKSTTIPHEKFSITHNASYFIEGEKLYLYNRQYKATLNMISVLSINLLTKAIVDEGIITSLEFELLGYLPTVIDGRYYLVKPGLEDRTGLPTSGTIAVSGAISAMYIGVAESTISGKLYCAPHTATNVMVIDPRTDTITFITGVAAGAGKYYGIAESTISGKLYCSPLEATTILVIDPRNDTIATIAGVAAGSSKYYGIAESNISGKLYCAPSNATTVLVIDPRTDTLATIANAGAAAAKYGGIAESSVTGKLYCAPLDATTVLVIDPRTDTLATIAGGGASGGAKYRAICESTISGKLYCPPHNATTVLVIDPTTDTISNVTGGGGTNMYVSIAESSASGKLYAAQYSATNILVIDPRNDSIASITGSDATAFKYSGIADSTISGKLYAVPYNATTVLTILPFKISDSNIILEAKSNKAILAKTAPNTIAIANASNVSRLIKLKNGKLALMISPSNSNNTSGLIEIDKDTFQFTDKRPTIKDTVTHGMMYTLKDGRVITAASGRAILFS